MKIARIRTESGTDFVVSGSDGGWTPLSDLDIQATTTDEIIAQAESIRAAASSRVSSVTVDESNLLSPVVRPGKILAVGLNYVDHAKETGAKTPSSPVIFAKYTSSLNGPYADVEIGSSITDQADYEVELAVIIGKPAKKVSAVDAMEYVFGYAVANDVSSRDHQRKDTQFSRSKSADTFCPIGPWITTADEVGELASLQLTSTVNGEPRQSGVVSDMVFDIPTLIEHLSATMTLETGDVILTGTPPGVGLGMTPETFLVPGDVVECTVQGLGTIRNRFVEAV